MSGTISKVVHPPEVAARIDRLCAFHETTKVALPTDFVPRIDQRPSVFRVFAGSPRIPLPTRLLDASTATLRTMTQGLAALPESLAAPPQDIKTLASWLHMAAGITGKAVAAEGHTLYLRACPSAGATYPTEIYVLALGVNGLDPGFYHFSAKDFSLYRLRDGWESLAQLKRGRPDLEILKTMPAVLLISSIFWRSAWRYGARSYRFSLLDAGHTMENLVQAGTGLGIQTMVRLHLNDRNTRELIGVPKDTTFDQYESVQGFVAWADKATNPITPPAQRLAPITLAPIARMPVSSGYVDHPQIRLAQEDCVAPGVALHDIRPPHTETCPLPEGSNLVQIAAGEVASDLSVHQTMARRRSVRTFDPHGISRDCFARLNRLSFRGGTYYPIMPTGSHLGLVRPFWFVHNVTGVAAGLWYYHANLDQFTPIRYGDMKFDCKYLLGDQETCQQASAVCILVADLREAMENSGPDAYRVGHLEAGIAAQRMYLGSTALNIACCAIGSFLDNDLRVALDLTETTWECVYGIAIGGTARSKAAGPTISAPAQNGGEGLNFR
jgi:SagB-type dehydrogenase family enzyme